ncbi:hypothetical protein [Nostoc sp. C052]
MLNCGWKSPLARRRHWQTNSCPRCGGLVWRLTKAVCGF